MHTDPKAKPMNSHAKRQQLDDLETTTREGRLSAEAALEIIARLREALDNEDFWRDAVGQRDRVLLQIFRVIYPAIEKGCVAQQDGHRASIPVDAGSNPAAPPIIYVVFDGPPGPESGRFVECEDVDGKSISVGEWRERPDGLWELRIEAGVRPWNAAGVAVTPPAEPVTATTPKHEPIGEEDLIKFEALLEPDCNGFTRTLTIGNCHRLIAELRQAREDADDASNNTARHYTEDQAMMRQRISELETEQELIDRDRMRLERERDKGQAYIDSLETDLNASMTKTDLRSRALVEARAEVERLRKALVDAHPIIDHTRRHGSHTLFRRICVWLDDHGETLKEARTVQKPPPEGAE